MNERKVARQSKAGFKDCGSGSKSLRVCFGGAFDGIRVAAAHSDDDGDAASSGGSEHDSIAEGEIFERQRETAEAVCRESIHTGLEEDQLRMGVQGYGERFVESRKVLFGLCSIWKFNVDAAALLVKREVAGCMEREGEDSLVVLKDAGGSIALVDVEIDDRDAGNAPAMARPLGCDGQIVEYAKSGAFVSESVVSAACDCARDARFERGLGSGKSGSGAGEGSLDESFGPGEADAPDDSGIERAVQKALDIGVGVDPQ